MAPVAVTVVLYKSFQDTKTLWSFWFRTFVNCEHWSKYWSKYWSKHYIIIDHINNQKNCIFLVNYLIKNCIFLINYFSRCQNPKKIVSKRNSHTIYIKAQTCQKESKSPKHVFKLFILYCCSKNEVMGDKTKNLYSISTPTIVLTQRKNFENFVSNFLLIISEN